MGEHARKWIVWQHNVYRSTVAKGKESQGNPGPQPQASNMRVMYWDSSLEDLAQGWADTCPDDHNPNRGRRGENYYKTGSSGPQNKDDWMGHKLAEKMVGGWY